MEMVELIFGYGGEEEELSRRHRGTGEEGGKRKGEVG